jgi:hypothetical protein
MLKRLSAQLERCCNHCRHLRRLAVGLLRDWPVAEGLRLFLLPAFFFFLFCFLTVLAFLLFALGGGLAADFALGTATVNRAGTDAGWSVVLIVTSRQAVFGIASKYAKTGSAAGGSGRWNGNPISFLSGQTLSVLPQ